MTVLVAVSITLIDWLDQFETNNRFPFGLSTVWYGVISTGIRVRICLVFALKTTTLLGSVPVPRIADHPGTIRITNFK